MRWFLAALLATAVGSLLLRSGPAPTVAALGAQGADAETPVGPLGSLPPRPALVEPAPDAEDGRLVVDPPVVWLDLAPGTSAQPELTVTNGAAQTVSLELETVPLSAGPDGAPQPSDAADAEVPSAARWVLLAERSLHLGSRERAHLWPTVGVPGDAADEAAAATVRLRASDGPEVASVVAIDPGGAPADVAASVELERRGASEAVARLTLRSSELTSVEGALQVGSWWGSQIVGVEVPPTLVLPEVPRVQEVRFRAPAIPGPYRLTVDLAPRRASSVTATDRTVLWSPLALATVALLVAVASSTVVARRRRR